MNAFYRTTLGVVMLCLCPLLMLGQKLEQITTAVETYPYTTAPNILDYAEHDGKVYTIEYNEEYTNRTLASLDLATGEMTYLSTDRLARANRAYGFSHFTKLDDQLYARIGSWWAGEHNLFAVGGEQASALTPPGVAPASDPVAFAGEHYFLALTDMSVQNTWGGSFGYRNVRTTALWKTDGTPEGTVEVVELPRIHPTVDTRNWLVAGEDALLISVASSSDSWHVAGEMYLYRTDGMLAPIWEDERYDEMKQFRHRVDYMDWQSRDRTLPVGYAGGYFVVYEGVNNAIRAIDAARAEVFDINHLFPSFVRRHPTDEIDFARVDGKLYMHIYDKQEVMATLFEISYDDRISVTRIDNGGGSNTLINSGVTAHDGKLYYSQPYDGGASIEAYDPATSNVTSLLTLGSNTKYDVFSSDNYLYFVPIDFGKLYRYEPTERKALSTEVAVAPSTYALVDDGLIVKQGYDAAAPDERVYVTYLISKEASSNEDLLQQVTRGERKTYTRSVDNIYGAVSETAVMYRDNLSPTRGWDWRTYDARTSEDVLVNRPDGMGVYGDYATRRFGTIYINGSDKMFLVSEQSVRPLIDAQTNDTLQFAWPDRNQVFGGQLFGVRSNPANEDNFDLFHYSIEGNAATPVSLATNVASYRWSSDDDHIWLITDNGSSNHLFILDQHTGATIADSEVGSDIFNVLATSAKGYWLATHSGTYGLTYRSFDGNTRTVIDLADDMALSQQYGTYALDDYLVFGRATEAGNYLWSASIATGELTALPAAPLSLDGRDDLLGKVVGDKLYFAHATDNPSEQTLWRTDGTAQGTYQVSTVDPLDGFLRYRRSAVVAGKIYFSGNGSEGTEIYSIDPSTDEVSVAADVNLGTGGSDPYDLTPVEDGLFFIADAGEDRGSQLFYLSGLSTATREVIPAISLTLFPNPTTERATVQVSEAHNLQSVEVIDNLGRRVLQQAARGQQAELDLAWLPVGTYHVVSNFASGQRGYGKLSVVR